MKYIILSGMLLSGICTYSQNILTPKFSGEINSLIQEKGLDPILVEKLISENKPFVRTHTEILYDSLVTYFFPPEGDSLYQSRTYYTYDNTWNLPILTETQYWNFDEQTWQDAEKRIQAYDEAGHEVLIINQYWSYYINDWAGGSKFESSYDENGNQLLYSMYGSWDIKSKDWIGSLKLEYEFIGKDKIDRVFISLWDTVSDDWLFVEKDTNVWDIDGNNILTLASIWDSSSSTWVIRSKYEKAYSVFGTISDISYDWVSDHWVQKGKFESEYNEDGQLIESNGYYWDTTAVSWIHDSKNYQTFDSLGNITLKTSYYLNRVSGIWIGSTQQEYTFDENGNQTDYLQYIWDPDHEVWVYQFQKLCTFDNSGNITSENGYKWEGFYWEEIYRNEYIFDPNGQLISEAYDNVSGNGSKYEYKYDDHGNTIQITRYYGGFGSWVLQTKGFYYGARNITAQEDIVPEKEILLFPNPASESFHLSGFTGKTKVSISDLNGRLVANIAIHENEEISIGFLKSGLYVVRINTSNGIVVKKLIKQ